MATETTEAKFEELREQIEGDLVAPGDQTWDAARQAWNLFIDQRPAAVAIPANAADVVEIVNFARDNGLRVAPQGTGHNAAPLGPLDGTILLRTGRLNEVEIDAESRRARVGAGVIWGEVTGPASEVGLAPLAGSSHDVGVVGYTLGGGLSWLGRKHGLASESVTSIEAVLADGRAVRADRETEPDLFWALRGGAGNFAAVTAMEFELHPVPELYAGMLVFPWDRSAEVLEAWRQWVVNAPEEATSCGRILQVPPLPDIPEPFRGRQLVTIEVAYLGDEESGVELLAPLRALGPEIDTFSMVPPAALSFLHMDPPEPVPGYGDHRMLGEIGPETIEAWVASSGPDSGSPLLSVELRHLGGALAREPEDAGALGRLDGEFAMFAVGMAAGPELVAALKGHMPKLMDAFEPWDAGRGYLNFTEKAVDAETLFSEDSYARLCEVKSAYDPDNIFFANQKVPSAG